jgi:hypothetical protein
MRTPNSRIIDSSSRASLLAREMEDAALRYAQMTEQIDSVLSAGRSRRQDAWAHGRKVTPEPSHADSPVKRNRN